MTVPAAHNWRSNAHLLADVAKLGYLDGQVMDVTYGRGRWWTIYRPDGLIIHDKNTVDGVDFRALPEADGSVDVVCFDPPYKLNGTPSLGDFDNAYGIDTGYVPWQMRHQMIREGITEAARVVSRRGLVLLKCQDQVCSGKKRWQTIEFTNHAATVGLSLVDRFDLLGKVRRQPAVAQKHARGPPVHSARLPKGSDVTAMSRRKGARNENNLVTWLRSRGRPHVERRIPGMTDDRGDLTGWPGVVVEAKNCVRIDLAAWIDQLETEIDTADADTGAVIVKRRGTTDVGRFYAVMTAERWERLMTEAGR